MLVSWLWATKCLRHQSTDFYVPTEKELCWRSWVENIPIRSKVGRIHPSMPLESPNNPKPLGWKRDPTLRGVRDPAPQGPEQWKIPVRLSIRTDCCFVPPWCQQRVAQLLQPVSRLWLRARRTLPRLISLSLKLSCSKHIVLLTPVWAIWYLAKHKNSPPCFCFTPPVHLDF